MPRIPIALAAALLAVFLPGTAEAAPRPPARVPYPCAGDEWPWGCVADCESGGRWDANTGNGFYGGLQFWQPTWKEFGGLGYAARADLATRAQQIAVGQEVLAVQGWEAWPECSKRYGLAGRVYTVKPGDTLASIARKYGVRGGWQGLYEVNKDMVGSRPELLNVGTLLVIPKGSGRALPPVPERVVFGPPASARPTGTR
ncbi:transglycosylase family protein [Streptomyces sp. NPDC091279]|uniref:LysM peptidoglycan-binding domain-containing protein n=1 Tax=unclassified Streptomyces TaxID=2593676 RepID=UPI0038221E4C